MGSEFNSNPPPAGPHLVRRRAIELAIGQEVARVGATFRRIEAKVLRLCMAEDLTAGDVVAISIKASLAPLRRLADLVNLLEHVPAPATRARPPRPGRRSAGHQAPNRLEAGGATR